MTSFDLVREYWWVGLITVPALAFFLKFLVDRTRTKPGESDPFRDEYHGR